MPTADIKIIQALTDVQFLIEDVTSYSYESMPEYLKETMVKKLESIKIKLENAYQEIKEPDDMDDNSDEKDIDETNAGKKNSAEIV